VRAALVVLLLLALAPASLAQELTPEKAKEAEKLLTEAKGFLEAENYDEALPLLEKVRELNPYEVMGPFLLGHSEYRLGVIRGEFERLDRAQRLADVAIGIDPRFGGSYFLLGLIGAHRKDYLLATFGFEKAFGAGYRASDSKLNLAQCLFLLGVQRASDPRVDVREPIRLFQGALDRLEALKDDLRIPEPVRREMRGMWLASMTNLVALHQRVGEPQEAEKLLTRLLRLEPGNFLHHYNMGLVKGTVGKFDDALAAYEKALELRPDPEWIEPYPRMAFIYAERKENEKAERYYLDYLGKHPNSWDALFRFAGFCSTTERPEQAIETYKRCLELRPYEIGAMFELGTVLKATKQEARGAKWIELFLRIEKEYGRK